MPPDEAFSDLFIYFTSILTMCRISCCCQECKDERSDTLVNVIDFDYMKLYCKFSLNKEELQIWRHDLNSTGLLQYQQMPFSR